MNSHTGNHKPTVSSEKIICPKRGIENLAGKYGLPQKRQCLTILMNIASCYKMGDMFHNVDIA
jgi:hypothetical protein